MDQPVGTKRYISTLDGRLPTVTLTLTQDDTVVVDSNVQNLVIVREMLQRCNDESVNGRSG